MHCRVQNKFTLCRCWFANETIYWCCIMYTIVMCRSRPLQTEFTNDLRCTQTTNTHRGIYTHMHTTWFEHFMRWRFFFWVTYVTPKLMTVEYLMEIYGEFVQNVWQLFTLFVFVFVFVDGGMHVEMCISSFFPFPAQCISANVCGFDLRLKN